MRGIQRYDAPHAANTLLAYWEKTKGILPSISDFSRKTQLHRQALKKASECMAEYGKEYKNAGAEDQKALLRQAHTLDAAAYGVGLGIVKSVIDALPSYEQESAHAAVNGRGGLIAYYADLRQLAREGATLADESVNKPLGRFATNPTRLLDTKDCEAARTDAMLLGRLFLTTFEDTQQHRHAFGPVVGPECRALEDCAAEAIGLTGAWISNVEQGKGGSDDERKTLNKLDRALDKLQAQVESYADVVSAEMHGFPPAVRSDALRVAEVVNDLVSTFTTFLDMKGLAALFGASRRESVAAPASSSSDFTVAVPQPHEEPQTVSSKPKSRSRSKRGPSRPVAQQPMAAPPKPAPDPKAQLRVDVRKALKPDRVTRAQAQSYGGNPIEIGRSKGFDMRELDYAVRGTALAIENTVSGFVQDKFGNRHALTAVLGKVNSALESAPRNADLQRWQADLTDLLDALQQMHAWARDKQSDAVKKHEAPRQPHLEYLLDTGQLDSVSRPRALPSTADPGDGRATLFEMVLQIKALSKVSGGQPAQPLYVHLHTRDDAPVTEDQCHALDFKHFAAVHVKTHAQRGRGRGWVQLQRETARQAASSNPEIIAPSVHRGRVQAPLLQRLRAMAA